MYLNRNWSRSSFELMTSHTLPKVTHHFNFFSHNILGPCSMWMLIPDLSECVSGVYPWVSWVNGSVGSAVLLHMCVLFMLWNTQALWASCGEPAEENMLQALWYMWFMFYMWYMWYMFLNVVYVVYVLYVYLPAVVLLYIFTFLRFLWSPSCVARSRAPMEKLSVSSLSPICDSFCRESSFFLMWDSTWRWIMLLLWCECEGGVD